ncbi:MAG TPA: beta-ketoacyl-ACP synthase II [Planctomycetota bacterium]|jgi:3-oxoacyl-[acyl-carrier-protein] synthase II|nr:beta-ketoacyl-ACP synthase II [Planctomycetota bacterium]OQC19957.1 MAG: 3-oxoacyl-(acyl-carrier-protein) synthase 2 [Planctomycetes bacterium ADurb.Bin069]HNR99502.1 beta-ketoacyl-ACP synthase II [Planctomycetota bacterium]HNU27377.1 beta-ketoacyl-ACP synthase II [Planctomycetota bacterium]HOE30496.1 beta-ketoacyl-ACP synthase II [Planctomycetota bacterium]
MRRVAITGLGAITPIGIGVEAFWRGVVESRSGGREIRSFDHSQFPVHFACEVIDFDPDPVIDKREQQRLDRFCQFALCVSDEALKDAALPLEAVGRERVGCVFASGIGGIKEIEEVHTKLLEKGPRGVSPFLVPKMMTNAAAGQIAIKFGLRGPNFAVTSACASGNHAIVVAYLLVKWGEADVVVTGGAEAAVTALGLGGFCSAKALSRRNDDPGRASRPFCADRDGFVMGEGAGALVLEDYDQAARRGARIYAEVCGSGMTDDAYHITAPLPDGTMAAACMRDAVQSAGIRLEDVDYINAHGTSTDFNDSGETKAIKAVFGPHAYKLAVSSTKSQIGHLLGASGAVEAVATALAIKHQIAPPTINYVTPDPECDLDYVPNKARPMPIRHALSNSFGFGGHNATLAFRRV